jgi:probable HAF family extracellular repeat protein
MGAGLITNWLGRLFADDAAYCTARGTDGTGSMIVGAAYAAAVGRPVPVHAVYWQAGGYVLTEFGAIPEATGTRADRAFGVSADGSVVVGRGATSGAVQPFLWTAAGGYQLLGGFDGATDGEHGTAYAVSADGNVVVGEATDASGSTVPFRWTQSGGLERLGDLTGGTEVGAGRAANTDGTVIVGDCSSEIGTQPFRWESGVMVGLGSLGGGGGLGSEARGVSGDGSRIVGTAGPDLAAQVAFFWDLSLGMQPLIDAMHERGFEEPLSDWELREANAITADGKIVVGTGWRVSTNEYIAWRVRLEP